LGGSQIKEAEIGRARSTLGGDEKFDGQIPLMRPKCRRKVMLKWIVKLQEVYFLTAFNRLRIGRSGGPL
jgi:hypothetical protein